MAIGGMLSIKKALLLVTLALLLTPIGIPGSHSAELDIQTVSETQYSSGTLVNLKVPSPETDYPMRNLFVWTPDVDPAKIENLPIVYFLHGWPGSPMSMISAITPVLAKKFDNGSDPFIAVFPDGNAKSHLDSEWADSSDGKVMLETWLTTNAITAAEGSAPRPKEKRAIVGFSMGGYGAAMIALHHPDIYTQVGTLAGYFVIDDLTRAFVGKTKLAYQTPNNYIKSAHNFRWYLAEAKDDFTQPIHGEMARWSALLKKQKVNVETHAPMGGHTFTFVAGQIPTLVDWFDWGS